MNVLEAASPSSGLVDASKAIQAKVNALPSRGGVVDIPPGEYRLDSDVTVPSGKAVHWNIAPGVRFTGTGSMPRLVSNTYHRASAWTATTKPALEDCAAGDGYSTISAEVHPEASFVGNACGAYLGARTPFSGTGFVWGLNTMAELNVGFGGNGISIEADLANYTVTPYLGQGVLVTGVGNSPCEVGVLVQREDVASRWGVGVRVRYSEIGIDVNLAEMGTYAQTGIKVRGLPRNHIQLQPSTDTNPSDAVMFVANAAGSQVNFQLTKRGGLMIGNGGTEIVKHLSGSAILNFGSVPAHGTSELTISVPGAAQGDVCYASPNMSLVSGFTWCAYCAAPDTVTVRIMNGTAVALDPDGGGGSTWRADVWKH